MIEQITITGSPADLASFPGGPCVISEQHHRECADPSFDRH